MKTSVRNFVGIFAVFMAYWAFCAATPTWHTASDGIRYLIEGEQKYNWLQAHDECARQNLQLVDINTAAKNNALVALLRNVFGSSLNLWLGYHDEFNKAQDKTRPFFSLATGQKLDFSNWYPNEPNNSGNNEHCVHIFKGTDFQWNDKACLYSIGYICEEHHYTSKYRQDLVQKRENVNLKNTEISAEFSDTQNQINKINVETHNETNNILLELKKSTDELFADFKRSIEEITIQKPYMVAVLIDLKYSIEEIVEEKEREFSKVSEEALQMVDDIYLNHQLAINSLAKNFEEHLAANTKEVNEILVI